MSNEHETAWLEGCKRAKRNAKLTDEEIAALDTLPDDAVSHWWRGEKWNFQTLKWERNDEQ